MHRLTAPDDFSGRLRDALDCTNDDELWARLCTLAQFELDYVQSTQLDRALKQVRLDRFRGIARCRLAILSSSTVDHLVPALRVSFLRHGFLLETYVTSFDQYRQELLDRGSALQQFQPEFALFSLSARDVLASIPLSASQTEIDEYIEAHLADLMALWRAANEMSNCSVIQQTYLNIGEQLFGSLDRTLAGAPTQVVRRLNQSMVDAAVSDGVSILDLDRPVEKYGLHFWYDNTRWLQAKIEISPLAATQYADLAAQIIASQKGLSKKCLVLDLDNTVWGGVIGDDGIEDIALGEGSALGEAYVAFQKYVKQLKDRGIILAVCSKNEQELAESVFRQHPEMVLTLDDVTVFVANWDDKASNLLRIADQLNIGVDSLVFVDDNPAERELVRQSLPMVVVPEMPEDPSEYITCLSSTGYFESSSFTDDDQQRNAQYAANKERKALAVSSQSIEDYLASLDMEMTAGAFEDIDLPRVAQLINKTNQFNATTHRRALEEVRAISSESDCLTLQVRLADRFGDNGLISAVILEPAKDSPSSYEIETWVMSCRVFGRQLEYEILNILVEMARDSGATSLVARHKPTAKNALIKKMYSDIGFDPLPDKSDADESRWILDVDNFVRHVTHINKRHAQ